MDDTTSRRRSGDPDGLHAVPDPADETISRLLRFAGPRPEAPPLLVARVQRAARPAWQEKVRAVARARRRRRAWSLAAAAVLVVSAGFALLRLAPRVAPAPPVRLAAFEALHGPVSVRTGGADAAAAADSLLIAGAAIETGRGAYATLRLAGGSSVRLDGGTLLELAAAESLELRRGAIYLDTGSSLGAGMAVTTPLGVARDVGTQFEVRLADGTLRVQVREGEVEVKAGAAAHSTPAGTALTVHGDGRVESDAVAAHGPAWRWVLEASPPFELDGKTLGEVLDWVARETGWQPRFREAVLEREARGAVVHGSAAGVRPDQAPDLVLASSGLAYRLEDGTLWIERAAP